MDWRHLRQQSCLTIAVVIASAVLIDMLLPALDLKGALIAIALVALLLGWVP